MNRTFAVIDFETTGHSPQGGGRATEIAAVLLRDGEIVGQYQSLMNTGAWIPPMIERLTGISNEMVASAPDAAVVMREVSEFTRGCGFVAHNASFDRGFWVAELARAHEGVDVDPMAAKFTPEFVCTVKMARRLYPESPNCKLGTLAQYHRLPNNGRAHRALADAMTTAQLVQRMQRDIAAELSEALGELNVEHELMLRLQAVARPLWSKAATGYARDAKRHLQASLV
ncbi:DNA polymerase-3 subunit epsilon [Roseateles sp. YR242]|uniref:3'-5' exonuclease n=1 Tax=Roseateles sp. YR242 TaxID=1855305 RepID=UPI0008B4D1CF|nr:exonuclease domain-containing protein [Roseateles sp. YR242]SEK86089.1 DNA polymerase-3 subunit epsilon [Roseateles sp. YR242]